MKTWWITLSVRERWILIGGSVVSIVLLFYALIWYPFQKQVATLQQTVMEQRAEVTWMRQAAREVQRLTQAATVPPPIAGLSGRSLLSLVDQTAREAGLGSALKRVEPQGTDQLRVQLDEVSFDALTRWLIVIEHQYGVVIDSLIMDRLRVDRPENAGRVNARLVLQGAA